jgi:hypothetical protein
MYFLTAENLDGCIGHSDTLFVEVNAAPAPPLLSDTTICYSGSAISLVLSNAGSVYWFDQQLDSLGILTQIASDSVTASLAYYGAHFNGECFSLFDTASVSLFQRFHSSTDYRQSGSLFQRFASSRSDHFVRAYLFLVTSQFDHCKWQSIGLG